MFYEIGIYYPDKAHDAQVKIQNIPVPVQSRRFWLAGIPIPHWNEDETNTWVKVPVLNGMTKIYVDNSVKKDLSNIDETMIFGDDFTKDLSKWTMQGDTKNWFISNNFLILNNESTLDTNKPSLFATNFNLPRNFILNLKAMHTGTIGGYPWLGIAIKSIETYSYYGENYLIAGYCTGGTSVSNIIKLFLTSNSTSTITLLTSYNITIPYNTFNYYKVTFYQDLINVYINHQLTVSYSDNTYSSNYGLRIDGSPYEIATKYDYIFVREYLPTDPIIKYIRPVTHLNWYFGKR